VWTGHSCPLPLILLLILTFRKRGFPNRESFPLLFFNFLATPFLPNSNRSIRRLVRRPGIAARTILKSQFSIPKESGPFRTGNQAIRQLRTSSTAYHRLTKKPATTRHQFVTKTGDSSGYFEITKTGKTKGAKGFKYYHLKIDTVEVAGSSSRSRTSWDFEVSDQMPCCPQPESPAFEHVRMTPRRRLGQLAGGSMALHNRKSDASD
jgi:hypothetical protein